ncbi:MAG: DUF58 domain-containing protein [Isosphaeraceae bacterium]
MRIGFDEITTTTRPWLPAVAALTERSRTPLGTLVLAGLASLLFGLFLHAQGFVVLSLILAAAVLGLIWPWMSVRGLEVAIVFDRARCREGEEVAATLTLRNHMPWSAWGVSIETGDPPPAGSTRERESLAGLARVPGWRTVDVNIRFCPPCRGVYPGRGVRVASGFPFGLWHAARPVHVREPLLVWPRTVGVGPIPEAREGSETEGLASRERPGNWGDPLGVRPYRRGDALRRVHWGQTARHGQLIVCEVQASAVPRVQIVLDTHRAAHAGVGRESSFEWAIRVGASFAEGWLMQGAEVETVHGDDSLRARGPQGRNATLDHLARLDPSHALELGDVLDSPHARRPANLVRLIVTTDRGLRALSPEQLERPGDRFVVLDAAGFDTESTPSARGRLPIVPWIRLSSPADAVSLRHRVKEVDRDA